MQSPPSRRMDDPAGSESWRLFLPKSITVLQREGYSRQALRDDLFAALTVAIVALPLSMAIAIASGANPSQGLITAIVAGFLISALGGSRFQIGGPTGAFIVTVFGVIAQHGYDGLVIATMMAGVILIVAGLLRVGNWIRYIPEPVVTGFTSGIALVIFASQLRDLFGIQVDQVPAEFIAKLGVLWGARESINPWAFGLALGSIGLILTLRRLVPKAPGFLIVVVVGGALAALANLPVETIASRFGPVSANVSMPAFPDVSLQRLRMLIEPALTIAFLAGIESLLSAMVADSMTGGRHRSNCELVAQGLANIASGLVGGFCATGAISRTATNIRAGARTPIAGMLHALVLLCAVLLLGPLLGHVPLASLAAILAVVCWNMADRERFAHILRGPVGDRSILLATFGLTVFVDLTIAIEVGVVLAALIFMHRMAQTAALERGIALPADEVDDMNAPRRPVYGVAGDLPEGALELTLRGALFYGAASRLGDGLEAISPVPHVVIVHMDEVPMADLTGVSALMRFVELCRTRGTSVILAGLQARVDQVLTRLHPAGASNLHRASDRNHALALARSLLSARG